MPTPGSEPRKRLFGVLRATFIGGILFLVPFVVLLIVLDKALKVSTAVVAPVAEAIPYRSVLGLPTPVFVAIGGTTLSPGQKQILRKSAVLR